MCGRVTLDIDINELKEILERAFNVTQITLDSYEKRYNIAPSQKVVAVINDGVHNRAGYLHWGFIPPYVQSNENFKPIINTRSETAHEKNSFKQSLLHRRCLIMASSFYEWNQKTSSKTPYNIRLTDQMLMPLAGIWSPHKNSKGDTLYTCSIMTVPANDLIKNIHDRMPVIMNDAGITKWLDKRLVNPKELMPLLTQYDPKSMRMYPVSTLVNNTKIDSVECIQKI